MDNNMKECPNCKGLNLEGSLVCSACGVALNNTQVNSDNSLNNVENVTNQTNNNLNNQSSNNQTGINENQTFTKSNSFNKNAVISVICSVVSLFIFWWLAFAGISCGVASLKQIKETGEKGKVLAILGIGVGFIDLVLYGISQMS